jgi:uncharacterized tellurite resistance protein B-like protein
MTDVSSRRAFATLVAAAHVDGDCSERERQVLHRKALELDVDASTVRELLELGRQGRLAVSIPRERGEREALLEHLIELVCADGRVEAAEHHLLAKFASHLGVSLPDLRERIKGGMTQKRPKRKADRDRTEPEPPPPVFTPQRMDQTPEFAPPPPERLEATSSVLNLPPGPVRLESTAPGARGVRDIPPVTLQLLKQAIQIETEDDAVRYVQRLMELPQPEAKELVREILAAFPDLKPASLLRPILRS